MATPIGTAALATFDMTIAQGADNPFAFVYKTEDGAGVRTAVNLTGWSARSQIRRGVGGEVWLTLVSPADITLGSDGRISFNIGHAVTEATEWNTRRNAVWDLELTAPGGAVTRFAEGTVKVEPDVTRAS